MEKTNNLASLKGALSLLDGNATTDQLASAIVSNAVRKVGGVPMADSRAIAEVFGRRHDNVLRSIDHVLETLPDQLLNFEEQIEVYTAGKGAERRRRYFTMNREGFNVLVPGFTGDEALRYRAGFARAFEWLSERERDNVRDFHKLIARNPSPHPLVIKKNKEIRADAQARYRRRNRSDRSPGDGE